MVHRKRKLDLYCPKCGRLSEGELRCPDDGMPMGPRVSEGEPDVPATTHPLQLFKELNDETDS